MTKEFRSKAIQSAQYSSTLNVIAVLFQRAFEGTLMLDHVLAYLESKNKWVGIVLLSAKQAANGNKNWEKTLRAATLMAIGRI